MFLEIVIFVGVFFKLPQIMSILEVDGRGQGANKMVHGTQRLTRQIVSGAIGSYIGNKTGNSSVYTSSSDKSMGENRRKESQSKSSDEMRKNSDFSDKKTGNSKEIIEKTIRILEIRNLVKILKRLMIILIQAGKTKPITGRIN